MNIENRDDNVVNITSNDKIENTDANISDNLPTTTSINNNEELNHINISTDRNIVENLNNNNEINYILNGDEKLKNGEDPDGILDWCSNLDQTKFDNIELI